MAKRPGPTPPRPLRKLDNGTPCWCAELLGEHSPRCLTLRAISGIKGDHRPWLHGGRLSHAPGESGEAARARFKRLFLDHYSTTGIIGTSCSAVGIGYNTVLDWRRDDQAFAAGMEQARELATDLLEKEARRRAFEGWLEPVYQGGHEIGVIRRYDSRLLELLLKGHRASRFRENVRLEASGPDGGPMQVETLPVLADHERELLRKVLEDAIKAQETAEAEVVSA